MSSSQVEKTTHAAVSVKNIDFSYGDSGKERTIEVLRDLSFSVNRGEFVSLLGPSGCGKTTLLRLIAGLVRLQRGEITTSQREANLGFVFQTPNLLPWLDTAENISLPLRVRSSQPNAKNPEGFDGLLGRLGLSSYESLYPWQLSLGMQMRANLGRALVTRPDILLLDEPFSALDAITSLNLQRDILRIWKERPMTCILVTHNIVDAVSLSDRVLLLSARPATVLTEYHITAIRHDSEPRSFDSDQGRLMRKILTDMQANN
jgi:ABC-type nitrate/sulfonate/bicarbonate transport system ATPase subunit